MCDAFCAYPDTEFHFIETEPMEAFRKDMGWQSQQIPSYVLRTYETDEQMNLARELARESDIVMIGSAPESFIEERLLQNKLTFRYTERPMKEGIVKMFIPRLAKKFYHLHYRNREKNIYLLAASAYAASDYKILHSYPDKCLKFGYFPAVESCEEAFLMGQKTGRPMKILWTGRFLKLKRADLLIEAGRKLKEKEIPFQMELVGNGEMEESLKALVKKYHLEDQISFHDFMSPQEVRLKMEQADIYVMTSNFLEGWGAVIYEGLSAGCAVVASHACGCAPWLVQPSVNGFLFQNGSAESLEEKLEFLLKNPEKTHQYGQNAYRMMQVLWNPAVAAKRLICFSKACIEGKEMVYKDGPLSKAEVLKNHWYHD